MFKQGGRARIGRLGPTGGVGSDGYRCLTISGPTYRILHIIWTFGGLLGFGGGSPSLHRELNPTTLGLYRGRKSTKTSSLRDAVSLATLLVVHVNLPAEKLPFGPIVF